MAMRERPTYARYGAVAASLHWAIAAAFLAQIGVGWWMAGALDAPDDATRMAGFEATQTHKAVGLTILALALLRLAWRLAHPAPPPPAGMPGWQRAASAASHWLLYGLTILLPLTGWAMVSTSPDLASIPTVWFGLFEIAKLDLPPALAALDHRLLHGVLAYGAVALVGLHVAAALKHHVIDGDAVLARMVPGLAPRGAVAEDPTPRPSDAAGRVGAGLLTVSALIAAALALAPERGPVAGAGPTTMNGASAGDAAAWDVGPAEGRVGFSGLHGGRPFAGVFERWRADIRFDPDRLEGSGARVEIEVASARTGDAIYDGALGEGDWLGPAEHKVALFEVDRFVAVEGRTAFRAEGRLTLRGVTRPITLPFRCEWAGDVVTVRGEVAIDRLDFGVGAKPDPEAAWVAREIVLEIELRATRRP